MSASSLPNCNQLRCRQEQSFVKQTLKTAITTPDKMEEDVRSYTYLMSEFSPGIRTRFSTSPEYRVLTRRPFVTSSVESKRASRSIGPLYISGERKVTQVSALAEDH